MRPRGGPAVSESIFTNPDPDAGGGPAASPSLSGGVGGAEGAGGAGEMVAAAEREARMRLPLDFDGVEKAQARALRVGRLAVVAVTVALLGLLGRVYQLQHHPSPRVAALVDSQVSARELDARRGSLVDRRQRVLATTRVAHLLFVDPEIVEDPNTFSEYVGYTLDYEPAWVEQTLAKRRGSRYIVLDPRMTEARYAAYQQMPPLRGLATHSVLVRDYPQNHVAGQLVGFIGSEGKGLDGLELAFNERLRPDPGQHAFVHDRGRNRLWLASQHYKLQADGRPIRLSIDLNMQAIAEQELAATVAEFKAESGQVVVMDPHTGEILALANYPFFDPADFATAEKEARRNRAVTDVFEPGSILKPFVWAAAIEAGLAKPDEMIDCTEKGWWKPARGPVLRDASPHGIISWDDVLKYSSNIGMAVVAERMGKSMLHEVVSSYGFGQTSGSDLPGEVAGLLRPAEKWSYADLTRIPMGQGVAVTALQIMRAFCSLGNDGVLINPTIEARDRQTADERRTNITARVLSPRVAQHTRQVLGRVITEGTGRRARSELYDLFGKTGTAQLPDFELGGYHQDKYIASFVAGAPLESPRLVVGVFIHDPDKRIGHYGGTVAGPPVKRVMERSLQYLGVPVKGETTGAPPRVAER